MFHLSTLLPLWRRRAQKIQRHYRLLLLLSLSSYLVMICIRLGLLIWQGGLKVGWSVFTLLDLLLLRSLWTILAQFVGIGLLLWIGVQGKRRQAGGVEAKGCVVQKTLSCGGNGISHLAWSLDGRILAISTVDREIWLWDVMTGRLRQALNGYTTRCLVWSPDGKMLAFPGYEGSKCIYLWNVESSVLSQMPTGDRNVYYLAWSPDGRMLASISGEGNIWLWDSETKMLRRSLPLFDYASTMRCLVWSPDGCLLASCSDATIRLWNVETGSLHHRMQTDHSKAIRCLAWSLDGKILASGSEDKTVRLWDAETGQTRILEGYADSVASLAFSADGRLLISSSSSKKWTSVVIWRTDTWERVTMLTSLAPDAAIDIHPKLPMLATGGEKSTELFLWKLDLETLCTTTSSNTIHYTNAKVVLVGDSGVGKSGLSLVLVGKTFMPTESTHGRRIWTLSSREIERKGRRKETREILLWDLAGQPGYRLIHQLYLNEVAVALVVFDARSETDPFSGVQHWDHALRQAHSVQGNSALPLKKFLIAARMDRGGVGVSTERIQALVKDLNFDGYFETSAKEGLQVDALRQAIQESIVWEQLPTVSSTRLFRDIKTFLLDEKKAGRLMTSVDDLYCLFRRSKSRHKASDDLRNQFETCIGRVEAAGLIKRLSFGNLVLLQPELLDAYASALVNAVKGEPDGPGSIGEDRVRAGGFRMPADERLKDREQEKLLLIAMIEDLLRRELVWREGSVLIFPSQSTREYPFPDEPKRKRVSFEFEGPVLNIYATLAVRLAQSGLFRKKELWKNAVTYTASVGGVCGILLQQESEGHGALTLFYDDDASRRTRYHFEEFIHAHLKRRALPESVTMHRIFVCAACETIIPEHIVQLRLERHLSWLSCPVCEQQVSLVEQEANGMPASPVSLASASRIREMDLRADQRREREAARSILQGKKVAGDFDVFLCHHGVDKPAVKQIGGQLKERGILPWLDEWELRPGLPWQRLLEEQIEAIQSVAVFVGKDSMGPWQQLEIEAFLREFVRRGCPVIPVLLPDASKQPQLPIFLKGMTWVDFRSRNAEQTPDALERLIWGITGKRNMPV